MTVGILLVLELEPEPEPELESFCSSSSLYFSSLLLTDGVDPQPTKTELVNPKEAIKEANFLLFIFIK